MGDNQLKLGKNKALYEETCHICGKELKDPNVYETGFTNSYFLCDKHDNWKFKTYIEFELPLLLFGVLVMYVSILLGVEDRFAERTKWIASKLEKGDG